MDAGAWYGDIPGRQMCLIVLAALARSRGRLSHKAPRRPWPCVVIQLAPGVSLPRIYGRLDELLLRLGELKLEIKADETSTDTSPGLFATAASCIGAVTSRPDPRRGRAPLPRPS